MSKFVGIFRKQRGKVGDFVFRKVGPEFIVSEKPPKKGTSMGTRNQALYRAQWGNLVRFWQSFSGRDRPSFEGATVNVSHFNLFMRANINGYPVYLTKELVRLGASVVAPYRISQGQLPVVGLVVAQVGSYQSSIQLGDLVISNSTNVKQFSDAVVTNNNDFSYGDQITIFVADQIMDATANIPRVKINSYKIELDGSDDLTMLNDIIPLSAMTSEDGVIMVHGISDGGAAIIHSRKTFSGETLVSTQSLVVENAILATYTSGEAMRKAAESYGIIDRGEYLTPNGENEIAAI